MEANKLNIIIVEDHSIITEGLSSILQSEAKFNLAGVFVSAEEALVFLGSNAVDVILLDITLPEMSGIEFCQIIKKTYTTIKIIALTNHTEKSVIQEMLQNGADGYLLKNTSKTDLITAITQVMNNQFIMQAELQKILFSPSLSNASTPRLTTREKEVLALVSQGITSNAIADKLYISPQTVETHRRNLMQKFEVNNSAALISQAMKMNLL